MRSAAHGRHTSVDIEVTNISAHGMWLLLDDRELFLAFKNFPWFKAAAIGQVLKVERPSPHHLYWPELDVDLSVESIEHPEKYPLVSSARRNKGLQPTRGKRRTQGGRGGARG